MKEYSAGFMFDASRSQVALIRKNRPDWQAGKLNGIGGHVERCETFREAMAREFEEETGVKHLLNEWYPFAVLRGHGHVVSFFRSFSDSVFHVKTKTDEWISLYRVSELERLPIIPNVHWLIRMALSMEHESTSLFEITETA